MREKQMYAAMVYKIRGETLTFCHTCRQDLKHVVSNVSKDAATTIKYQHNEITNMTRTVANMHPENVLKRGYSITLIEGKAVKSIADLKIHDTLQTVLADGSVTSEVKSIKNPRDE